MYFYLNINKYIKNNKRKSVATLEPSGALGQVRDLRGGHLESVPTPVTSNQEPLRTLSAALSSTGTQHAIPQHLSLQGPGRQKIP